MKLVLVAGFNTRNSKDGPRVQLAAGKWKIITEHHTDAKLVLCSSLYEGTVEVKDGSIFPSEGECFWLRIANGTEEFINVFAEFIPHSNEKVA